MNTMTNFTNMTYMYETNLTNETNGTNETGSDFSCLADDVSSTSYNGTFWKIHEDLRSGAPAVATVFALYFLLASVWNLFIIVTFLRKRRLLKEPANILLLNLAIADMTVAITQMLFSTITASAREFVFGPSDVVRCAMCDFTGIFFMLLYGVSMHTLAALSFERFLLLYKPFNYKKIMSQNKVIALVVVIWVAAFILALLPVFGFGQIEFNFSFGSCVPRFGGTNTRSGLSNFYYVAFIAIEALFPIITIAICSFWTYWFVNKFLKRNYRRRSFYNRSGPDHRSLQRQEDSRYHRQQHQLVKVFGALLICNIISWSPVLIVVVIVAGIGDPDEVPRQIYIFGWICYLTAPVFHPIIESFFVKDMRLVVCKGVDHAREAGSFIVRSTTNMFGQKELERQLDLANEKADEDGYVSKRKIQPFGRKRGVSTLSTNTEVTDIPMPTSRDNTPSPKVAQKVEEANVQLREKTPDFTPKSQQRRITFSDELPPQLETPTEHSTHNGIRKSVLKSPKARENCSLAPLNEVELAPLSDSSPDVSVFDSPRVSPLPNGHPAMPERSRQPNRVPESEMEQQTEVVTGNITHVPLKDDQESSNGENDLQLHTTVYNERRGSLTLV